MALYETNTVTDMADLISSLNTFFTTSGAGNPGWTADVHTPASGRWAISKDDGAGQSVEVAFQWDTGTPNSLGIYQYHTGLGAGSYNTGGGTVPYDQDGDSGNGDASASESGLATGRKVTITNTPLQYWAFAGDTYGHVVVNTATDIYVHFGFGVLDKFNDWTGGEYAYGDKYHGGVTNSVALQPRSSYLLDGYSNGTSPDAMQDFVATLHMESFNDQPTGGLWGVCMGNQASGSLGNDRQASPKGRIHVLGGFRAGSHATDFGQFIGTTNMGLVPVYPIVAYHWDRDINTTSGTPNALTPLGVMKDVRGVLLTNFAAEDTVVIGSDTWHIFPTYKKWSGSGALTNSSGYQGIMYKEN